MRSGLAPLPRKPSMPSVIQQPVLRSSSLNIEFDTNNYPSAGEVAGWTLTLGGGVELPFTEASSFGNNRWTFTYTPGWADGDQVVVSIRNDEVQNRLGQVKFKARRHTIRTSGGNIVYGKTHCSYDHEPDKFGQGDSWELLRLNVTTDKTGDTDPVWISATFRAHNVGDAGRAYQGYWEGEFEDFHTLFLRWVYNEGGIGKGEATYTLPLKAASAEGGIGYRAKYDGRPDNFHVSGGHDVTFTWVRTYKEFQDKHLDLANHADMSAHMLAPPQPATARLTVVDDGDNLQRQYVPTTVTGVKFTSNPGSDQVYGVGSTIQVTVTFSDDVTVGYKRSKKHAAEIDLELGGQTRTAHYARTEGKKVILEYTVVPGDNAPVALRIPVNSLRLYRDKPSEHGSIRDSDGRDVHLDHAELASQAHRVTGDDSEVLEFDTSNKLVFNEDHEPDFEGQNSYSITITARSRGRSTTLDVTIEVVDTEDAGEVSLSQRQPQVGRTVAATLGDPDGGVTLTRWTWATSDELTSGTCRIDATDWNNVAPDVSLGAYTPRADDEGKCLRATATYTDNIEGHGPPVHDQDTDEDGLQVLLISEAPVQESRTANAAPRFVDQDLNSPGDQSDRTSRKIAENTDPQGVVRR